jgi:hypothetical protein
MKRLIALLLLLATLAQAQTWPLFTAPDESFSVEFPGTPKALPGGEGKHFGWAWSEGDTQYIAGYSIIPGYSKLTDADEEKAMEVFVTGAMRNLKNPAQKPGPDDAVDIKGTNRDGLAVRMRVLPAPDEDRIFVMKTVGEADFERFFKSFKE